MSSSQSRPGQVRSGQVNQEIRNELEETGEIELKVGEVRPTRNNTQTITIKIDKESVEILLRKEFIMVG